ncbi:hypothetical protein BJ944DRAFT_243899 [Cunninghamella echinulata]|nr:hypothetical protein BJ944DRAFT_243899 [Cunninghamella echinulata]
MPPQANSKRAISILPKIAKPYDKNSNKNKKEDIDKLPIVFPNNPNISGSKEIKAEGDAHLKSKNNIKEKLEAIIALHPLKDQEHKTNPSTNKTDEIINHFYKMIQEYTKKNEELTATLNLEREQAALKEKNAVMEEDNDEEIKTINQLRREIFEKECERQRICFQSVCEKRVHKDYQEVYQVNHDKNTKLCLEIYDIKQDIKELQEKLIKKELCWKSRKQQYEVEKKRLEGIEATWNYKKQVYLKNEEYLRNEAFKYRSMALEKGKKRGSSSSSNESVNGERSRKRQHTESSQQNMEILDSRNVRLRPLR